MVIVGIPAPMKRFNIVLVEPQIPPNTGSIARLCGATNSTLHLVHPLGFSTEDKHLKRAGLDYWHHVEVIHWQNLEQLLTRVNENSLKFFTTKTTRNYTEAVYHPGDFLIFGKETSGLSEQVRNLYHELCFTLPMENNNIRSLNLAMTAGIVLYEAIRQQNHQ
jgi:tRNA (cytidine/uridine-2'-O-)-methyltransferase